MDDCGEEVYHFSRTVFDYLHVLLPPKDPLDRLKTYRFRVSCKQLDPTIIAKGASRPPLFEIA
jgi:hypothetical protein